MKKLIILLGMMFVCGFFLLLVFGCATPEEAVKEEEAVAPKEEEVVKEEPPKEEVTQAEEAALTDADEDGVTDDMDKCPDTPYGIEVDASGCPPDSDGDGVYDYLDMCPDTAYGAAVDPFGCPEAVPALQEGVFKIVLEFDTNSARIRPVYLTKYMKEFEDMKMENPDAELVSVEIRGHTDNTGTARYNYQLSEKRANSVKRFVVDQFGVDSRLITLQAFGATKPIASNRSSAGRQKNRRVEVIFNLKNLSE
jgi:OOP family OmpA-OmpF porin